MGESKLRRPAGRARPVVDHRIVSIDPDTDMCILGLAGGSGDDSDANNGLNRSVALRVPRIAEDLRIHTEFAQGAVQPIRPASGAAVQFSRDQVEYFHAPSATLYES